MPTPDRVRAVVLGTGTSTGVPVIGCECRVCSSADSRDRRTRCSLYLEADGVSILIDAGPDLRQQALREGLREVDAVLFTHHHFDHVAGIDDLRPFLFRDRSAIPCYAPPDTAAILESMFSYIFVDGSYPGVANLRLAPIDDAPFLVRARGDAGRAVTVQPIPVMHGDAGVFGYRVGNLAWVTDTNHIPDSSMALLRGVEVLILDALRQKPHGTHFSIPEAVAVAARVGARDTFLVHMTHSVLHAEVERQLPSGVRLAWDGLVVEA